MRLVSIELRDFRCFDHLELELDQAVVLVGANDTGKSVVLEAIRWLVDLAAVDWEEAKPRGESSDRDEVTSRIVGTFGDLTASESELLAPYLEGEFLRIGLSSNGGAAYSVVVSKEAKHRIYSNIDPEFAATVLETVDERSFWEWLDDNGMTEIDDAGRIWIDADIWEFGAGLTYLDWLIGRGMLDSIVLGTSGDTSWSPAAVLAPLIRKSLEPHYEPYSGGQWTEGSTEVGKAASALVRKTDALLEWLSRAHSSRLPTYSDYRRIEWSSRLAVADMVTNGLLAGVSTSERVDPEETDRSEDRARFLAYVGRSRSTDKITQLDELGPGTRRAVALAALELFRDSDLWPADSSALILIEEPETGLHPAAQRRVAAALRDLSTFGIQIVMTTHSPIFINAVDPGGIRLAKLADEGGRARRTVVQPRDLGELRDSLGIRPADVLLARRFVVVEGESDAAIIASWAGRMGVDLSANQIQLVAAGGYSSSDRVASFLNLAYEGADVAVVLDNGSETVKTKMEIEARFGQRVRVVVLSRTDIEGFFAVPAVTAWLLAHGAVADGLQAAVNDRLRDARGGRVGGLTSLARQYLGRNYSKVEDGRAIADLTLEQNIDSEIKSLVTELQAETF